MPEAALDNWQPVWNAQVSIIKYGGITTNLTMKSLVEYYWYVKMPQCRCVEYELEYFSFYVQKHIAHLAALFWTPAGLQRAARGAQIFLTRLLKHSVFRLNS